MDCFSDIVSTVTWCYTQFYDQIFLPKIDFQLLSECLELWMFTPLKGCIYDVEINEFLFEISKTFYTFWLTYSHLDRFMFVNLLFELYIIFFMISYSSSRPIEALNRNCSLHIDCRFQMKDFNRMQVVVSFSLFRHLLYFSKI